MIFIRIAGPVKVKEMGFVDFLLQDDDPDKMSEASSVRSHNFSGSYLSPSVKHSFSSF